jgi:hypothetical protein
LGRGHPEGPHLRPAVTLAAGPCYRLRNLSAGLHDVPFRGPRNVACAADDRPAAPLRAILATPLGAASDVWRVNSVHTNPNGCGTRMDRHPAGVSLLGVVGASGSAPPGVARGCRRGGRAVRVPCAKRWCAPALTAARLTVPALEGMALRGVPF